jgi:MarR family transcriptional regulator, organic hydroperoxide resistance regulator
MSPLQPAQRAVAFEAVSDTSSPNDLPANRLLPYRRRMDGDPAADTVPLEMLLPRVGAAVARRQRRLAARHGVTPTAVAVLTALDAGDSPSHRELAARIGLSPTTITPVLDRLEAAGEIRRERDTGDRRVVRVHRTAAGAARLSSAAGREAWLPEPVPELEAAVRAWLLAVLAAAEADE